jgi:hypothetical protein
MKNFLDDLREAYTGGVKRYWEGREKIAEQVEVISHEKKFAFIPMISHDLQVLWLTNFWRIKWVYYTPLENSFPSIRAEFRVKNLTVDNYIEAKLKREI